jgi:hypothetical protein
MVNSMPCVLLEHHVHLHRNAHTHTHTHIQCLEHVFNNGIHVLCLMMMQICFLELEIKYLQEKPKPEAAR